MGANTVDEFIAAWRKFAEQHDQRTHWADCYLHHPACAVGFAIDEIVRLRAEVERLTNGNNIMGLLWNAERALADQLAEAVKGLHHAAIIGVYRPTEELAVSTAALAAYEEARRG